MLLKVIIVNLRKYLILGGMIIAALFAVIKSSADNASTQLVIHEWGTFTALQDENGETLGHINTDDEPVPDFVHILSAADELHNAGRAMTKVAVTDLTPALRQAIHPESILSMAHPDVTMRLETPVLYFYPGAELSDLTLDVNVQFRGGVLNEFYPFGVAGPAGLDFIRPDTLGTLSWRNLSVGNYAVEFGGPVTSERVWLAPREVGATAVMAQNGEIEKYLFYRGVGNINSPIRVKRSSDGNTLSVRPQIEEVFPLEGATKIEGLWLVDIREDGSAAFRALPSLSLSKSITDDASIEVPAIFNQTDYSSSGTSNLRSAMHKALMQGGLFSDEAHAMLNTWEVSYFKSPGLRIFYVVPKSWTDFYLPLQISREAKIERVMIGRVELVTPKHRELLDRIEHAAIPDMAGFIQKVKEVAEEKGLTEGIFKGVTPLSALAIDIPEAYAAYLQLGRFRQAILLNEFAKNKSATLEKFIKLNKLEGYRSVPGERLLTKHGCLGCHSLDGRRSIAPTFRGIYGREGVLSDGSSYVATEEYIRKSLIQPGSQLVSGFSQSMPTFEGRLSDGDIKEIVEYLKTLE